MGAFEVLLSVCLNYYMYKPQCAVILISTSIYHIVNNNDNVLLIQFTSGMADALRCYQCDSGTYSGCQETEFNPRGIPIVEYHDDDFSDTCPLCQKATFNGRKL